MKKTKGILLLLAVLLLPFPTSAQVLGPVSDYQTLLLLAQQANDGDVIYVDGPLQAETNTPLTTAVHLTLTSLPGTRATVQGLRLRDANLTLSSLNLEGSLDISGQSNIILDPELDISGSGSEALYFEGSGQLLVSPGVTVRGLNGAGGVTLCHNGGSFYGAIEGTVIGGDGDNGGAGVLVSPLSNDGLLLIDGNVSGGNGSDVGGNAVNLYGVDGNAYIYVAGQVSGGQGYIGGDGVQIISARGTTNIGLGAHVNGGNGLEYGGNGLMLMNTEEQASVSVSGALIGGDSLGAEGEPGQSMLVVGNQALSHLYLSECDLRDGQAVYYSSVPDPSIMAQAEAQTQLSQQPVPDAVPVQPQDMQNPAPASPELPPPAEVPANPESVPQVPDTAQEAPQAPQPQEIPELPVQQQEPAQPEQPVQAEPQADPAPAEEQVEAPQPESQPPEAVPETEEPPVQEPLPEEVPSAGSEQTPTGSQTSQAVPS